MRKMLMLCAALSLPACASKRPIVSTPLAACSSLTPSEWAAGVEAASIPDNAPVTLGVPLTDELVAMIVAPWASAYVAMSGQLEKANGRTKDAMTIQANCEKMVNASRTDAK